MTEIQESIKKFTGCCVNERSHVFAPAKITAICNEQIVYTIMQLTGKTERRIINHVLRNVISFGDTFKYAELYGKLPDEWVCEEIYLMGFENWSKFETL